MYLLMTNENYCCACERWDEEPSQKPGFYYIKLEDNQNPSEFLGKKLVDNEWIEVIITPVPEPIPEPTEEEIVQAELLLNQLLMQEQLNSIDVVNAQILLNTMGGI